MSRAPGQDFKASDPKRVAAAVAKFNEENSKDPNSVPFAIRVSQRCVGAYGNRVIQLKDGRLVQGAEKGK
jgi:hypothetical protein